MSTHSVRLSLYLALFVASLTASAQNVINTYAGGGPLQVPRTNSSVTGPYFVATDAQGNVYFDDQSTNTVMRWNRNTGTVSRVVGQPHNGTESSGDGGPATSALLSSPTGIAVDGSGNIYVAEAASVRMVSAATGIITTVAGTGVRGYNGDGAATSVQLYYPQGLAVQGGTLYIADSNNRRVRRLSGGQITTIMGDGSISCPADQTAASDVRLGSPMGLALSPAGDLFVSDQSNEVVYQVSGGTVTTVAGQCFQSGVGGEKVTAAWNGAQLDSPLGLAFVNGSLYIADVNNNRIRIVSGGLIATVAGITKTYGFSGDGGLGTNALLKLLWGLASDSNTVFIADQNNFRIRSLDGSGIINTAVGNGFQGDGGDGGDALNSQINNPSGIAIDASNNVYVSQQNDFIIRKIAGSTHVITRIAGNGQFGSSGDGGTATAASLTGLRIASNSAGDVFVVDSGRLRKIDHSTQLISSIGGISNAISLGIDSHDNVFIGTNVGTVLQFDPLVSSSSLVASGLSSPNAFAFGSGGELYVADTNLLKVFLVQNGTLVTYAGTGSRGFTNQCDGRLAANAALPGSTSQNLAIDSSGNLLMSGYGVVCKIDHATGLLTTIAGGGSAVIGDGGLPTNADMNAGSIAVDSTGKLFIVDVKYNRIRVVELDAPTGSLTPASLDFGSVNVGSQSPTKVATLTNTGTQPLQVLAINVDPQYLETDNCPPVLSPTSSCSLQVALAPSTAGSQDGALTITTNAVMPQISIPLTGTGTASNGASPTVTTLSSNPATVAYNQSFDLSASVTSSGAGTITGTVSFYRDGVLIGSASVSNGAATLTAVSLPLGTYQLTATYSGDSLFLTSQSAAIPELVQQASSTLTFFAAPNPADHGTNVDLTATVVPQFGGTATGTVTFKEGATTLGSAVLQNNAGTYSLSTLSIGSHLLTAVYSGDSNVGGSTSSQITLTINKESTTTTLTADSIQSSYGQPVVLSATVSTTSAIPVTGLVSFFDGATFIGNGTVLNNNVAQLPLPSLTVGSHNFSATYQGDSNFLASSSAALAHDVVRAATSTLLSVSPNPATYGQTVTLTARITPQFGGSVSGTVSFFNGAIKLADAAVLAGQTTASYGGQLPAGSYNFSAVYNGDANLLGSASGTVPASIAPQQSSTVLDSSPNPSYIGQNVVLSASVTATVIPTGVMNFYDGNALIGTAGVDSAGHAATTVSIGGIGSHSLTAVFSSTDSNVLGSTSNVRLQNVTAIPSSVALTPSPNPATYGQHTVVTAVVTPVVGGTATGTITFFYGQQTLGVVNILNDSASLDLGALAPGFYLFTAAYSGDALIAPSSGSATAQVISAPAALTLTVAPDISYVGQPITLTAATSPATGPTGTVTFYNGSIILGSATLSAGVATLQTSSLYAGSFQFHATYAGDTSFQPATSADVPHTVNFANLTPPDPRFPAPHLEYYGNAVMDNVKVQVVFWGPNVDANVQSQIGDFYTKLTDSTFMDLLGEYSTHGIKVSAGPNVGQYGTDQYIDRGSFAGATTISPSLCTTNPCTLDDADLQAELTRQIDAGNLPQPETDANGAANTVYMVYFPEGVTITEGGEASCQQFCAYHSTITWSNKSLLYGVMPDFGPSSACSVGCGKGSAFENLTSASSHELAESVTDPGVGIDHLSWYSAQKDASGNDYGEASDVCQPYIGQVAGYSVQLTWSNAQGQCAIAPAVHFQLSMAATASPGVSTGATLSAFDSHGDPLPSYTGTVHITSSDPQAVLPADFTFSAADQGVKTFNITLQTPGSQTITAFDVSNYGYRARSTVDVAGTQTVSVTIGTVPSGLTFDVDGTDYSSPQTWLWKIGSTHSLAVLAQGSGGTQYVFQSWTDGGLASHTVTASAGTASYSATFSTQYQLITAASPASGGSVSPATQYYNAGSVVPVSATPNQGYSFLNWSGPVSDPNASSTTVAMTAPVSIVANFAGAQATSHTSLSANPVTPSYNQQITLSASVTPQFGSATGTVSFFDAGSPIGQAPVQNGVAQLTNLVLSVGPHTLTATYSGDSNVQGSSSLAITVTVNKALPQVALSSDTNPSVYSTTIHLTATVTPPYGGSITGTVTFFDGNSQIASVPVVSGSATLTTSSLAVATHLLTATYIGDSNLDQANSSVLSQVVNPIPSSLLLTSTVNPSIYGQSVTVTASVTTTGTPTGNVTFFDNGVAIGSSSVSGTTASITTQFAVGSHPLTAQYAGNATVASSTSPVFTETTNKASSTTVVSTGTNPSLFGSSVVVTATVTSQFNAPVSGTVTFFDNGVQIGTAALSNGTASVTLSAPAVGTHPLTASYSGDASVFASTSGIYQQAVNQLASTTSLSVTPNPSSLNQSVTLTATIFVQNSAAAPSGTVTFFDSNTPLATVNVVGNSATSSLATLVSGQHALTARYNGNVSVAASTSLVVTQTVSKLNSTTALSASPATPVYGQAITLTATVTASVTPTGTITFADNGIVIGAPLNLSASGTGSIQFTPATIGAHSFTANYSGNSNLNPSSGAVARTVAKASTTAIVTSSSNPGVVNQPITYTVTVRPQFTGVPSGTVQFQDGGTVVQSVTLTNGQATYTVSYTNLAKHTISAVYSGDGNFLGSTSSNLVEQIKKK